MKTAQFAVREKAIYPESSMALLEGLELIDKHKAREQGWFNEHRGSNDYFWGEKLNRGSDRGILPISDEVRAFYRIDDETGQMYAILPDGSGGGALSTKQQLEELQLVINYYMSIVALLGHAGMVSGPGGVALGVVAQYGITLTKLYGFVCEAIIIMDASALDQQIEDALAELACNIAKEIAFGITGQAGAMMAGIDNLISQMGGPGLVNCAR